MGSRNADRIPLSDRYTLAATVGDMITRRWEVISKCRVCGLMMVVDLAMVAREAGPKTSLWNRTQRCRRIGCNGRVDFQAKAPGMAHFDELRTYDQPDRPGWAQQQLERRGSQDGRAARMCRERNRGEEAENTIHDHC